jgi:hypothetical protein
MAAKPSRIDEHEISPRLKLRESIDRLKAQQLEAEKIAGLSGMSLNQSRQYRIRHRLITRLTGQLLNLENENDYRKG